MSDPREFHVKLNKPDDSAYREALARLEESVRKAEVKQRERMTALKDQVRQRQFAPTVDEVTGGTDLTEFLKQEEPKTAYPFPEAGVGGGITMEDVKKAAKQIHEASRRASVTMEQATKSANQFAKVVRYQHLGHFDKCVYDGTHDYACTCQPPTLWGRTLLWHCDCCGKAMSHVQYGLCDMCYAHQYASVEQARLDHEAASLD